MDNEAGYSVSKEQVEAWYAPIKFTDEEWQVIAHEIRELLEHTLDLQLADIVADLENLMADDDEEDSE